MTQTITGNLQKWGNDTFDGEKLELEKYADTFLILLTACGAK